MDHVIIVSIPIPAYYDSELFYQDIIFADADISPTLEQVKNVLERLHQESLTHPQYSGDYANCIKTLEQVRYWPALTKHHIVCESVLVPVLENVASITVRYVPVYKIE